MFLATHSILVLMSFIRFLKSFAGILIETRDLVKDVRTFIHLTDLYDSQTEKFQHMFDTAKQCSNELNVKFLTSFSYLSFTDR